MGAWTTAFKFGNRWHLVCSSAARQPGTGSKVCANRTHLTNLGPIAAGGTPSSTVADLVDSVIGTDPATKSGYTFAWTGTVSSGGTTISSYTLVATPVQTGVTGQRGFFTNQSGVIRADPAGTATVSSTPLS